MAGEHQRVFIPIGDFSPDPPHLGTGKLRSLINMVPMGGGALSVCNPRSVDAGLVDANWTKTPDVPDFYPVGSMFVHYTSEVVTSSPDDYSWYATDLFFGSDADLGYIPGLDASSFSNLNNGGAVGAYGTGTYKPVPWSFASWSWDSVVATNGSDPVQIYYYGGTGKFTDMITRSGAATTMLASHAAVLGRHIVLADIKFEEDPLPTPNGTNADCLKYFGSATDLLHPDIVWWSGTDDETTFGDEVAFPGENTSWQPLWDTPGGITGLAQAGDRALLIFKEHSIYIMELTGSDELFHFSLLSSSIGTRYAKSIVTVGRDVYFIETNGRPHVVRNLSTIEEIGHGVVSTFFGATYWGGSRRKEQDSSLFDVSLVVPNPYGAYSPSWNSIFWTYAFYLTPSSGSPETTRYWVHRALCYAIAEDKWYEYELVRNDLSADGFGGHGPRQSIPLAGFSYDRYSYNGSGYDVRTEYPGIIAYNCASAFDLISGDLSNSFLFIAESGASGGDASVDSLLRTKPFSFSENSVGLGVPACIHAVRLVHDGAGDSSFSVHVGSSSDSSMNLRVTTKLAGSTQTRAGWYTVPNGKISGEFFWLILEISSSSATANGPHILGFEVEYSLGGTTS